MPGSHNQVVRQSRISLSFEKESLKGKKTCVRTGVALPLMGSNPIPGAYHSFFTMSLDVFAKARPGKKISKVIVSS